MSLANYPYVGPPAHYTPGDNKAGEMKWITIHSAVAPCVPGMARKIAKYFMSRAAGGSAHYCVDPEETIQSAWDRVICWHAPPNPRTIGIEMCDQPANSLLRWFMKGTSIQHALASKNPFKFMSPNYRKMLRKTARLTAELCIDHDLPPYFRTAADLRAGKRGVTTHAEVSKAFGQSTHWDPGAWPRKAFMRRVRRIHAELKENQK